MSELVPSAPGGSPGVIVVGLGPADAGTTTAAATARLAAATTVRLRTHRHPAAEPWAHHDSFDHHYEAHDTFGQTYAAIVDDLVGLAQRDGEVVYAVPGSPWVLEETVRLLLADGRVSTEVIAGMSFLDLAWARLGVDPVEAGVRLVDGHTFATSAADATGALLVAHCHANHVLSDIKLAYDDAPPARAVILQRLGLPDEAIVEVDWADLDRTVAADHLTTVFVPAVEAPVAAELVRFEGLVRELRERCPWDREQTHRSLTRYAIEETFEVVEAIEAYDPDTGEGVDDLAEELGDLLYQVFFHATIASQDGAFTLGDVARGIHDKLYRRHPHVFGPDPDLDPDLLEADWERIKQAEKGRGSAMDGIPAHLPALAYASKILSRAARADVSLPAGVLPSDLPSDSGGPARDGDASWFGDHLLRVVHAARAAGVDAETALRVAANRVRDEVLAAEAEGAVRGDADPGVPPVA